MAWSDLRQGILEDIAAHGQVPEPKVFEFAALWLAHTNETNREHMRERRKDPQKRAQEQSRARQRKAKAGAQARARAARIEACKARARAKPKPTPKVKPMPAWLLNDRARARAKGTGGSSPQNGPATPAAPAACVPRTVTRR